MSQQPGRNAPCPCGSGRKYKQCCLAADEARARAERAAPLPEPVAFAPSSTDGADESVMAAAPDNGAETPDLWDRFQAAEYEEQIALFRRALRAGELDSELAFEMLGQIAAEAAARQEPEQVAALVREYATTAPELYAPDAGYYAGWLLDAALASGRLDEIPAILEPFARDPVEWADELFRIADQLMYHGVTAPLVRTLEAGWPRVQASGQEALTAQYGELLGQLRLLAYLAEHPGARPDDPALWEVVSPYLEADPATFRENLAALLGTRGRAWQPRDFESAPRTEPRERRLWLLGWEWLGDVWRHHGVAPSRALLATETLLDYQTDQASRGKPKNAAALLVPAPRRLDRFLGRYLTELTWQPYRAGALLGLLPLYLDFLVRRRLVAASAAPRARAELASVASDLLRVLEHEHVDPALIRDIAAAWFPEASQQPPGD